MSDERRQFTDQRYIHFITFSVFKKRKLLDFDQPKRIMLGVLNHQLKSLSSKCVGFVIMPNHVHSLIWLNDPMELTRFIHGWKRMSSFKIREWYTQHAPTYFEDFGKGDQFWQPKNYTFHVYSEKKLKEKLDYMHMNPVREKLVERTVDWKWSSARWYHDRRSVGVKIDWVEAS
jgi:putative transposase